MTPAWLIWASDALLALAVAVTLAIGPQGLLSDVSGERPTWRRVACLGLPAAAVGLATLAGCAALGKPLAAGPLCAAAVCLAAVIVVDGRWMVIPDVYVVALAILGLAGAAQLGWVTAAIGAALGGGLLAAVRWGFLRFARVEGLGFGDVKLMAAIGLLVGPAGVLWVVIWGSAIGAIWILLRPRGSDGQRAMAPFGACAAAPALVVLALGRLT